MFSRSPRIFDHSFPSTGTNEGTILYTTALRLLALVYQQANKSTTRLGIT